MKYPQLVSPRAVNAISDWLVSRLDQLGVESPQIYTRLLLSLLQSSVQVNDPIEFSNLEAFFANRKGGHNKRFHLPSDTEALKKLNAVQCLREIVSNEQETAVIEQLVDELCEKLQDIEKRTQELNDEQRFLIDTQLNIEAQPHQTADIGSGDSSGHHRDIGSSQTPYVCRAAHIDTRRLLASENDLKDTDNDPKKRYFRAFPALTKEMEDSFRIWRRNAKSLTWPVVGRSIVADSTSLVASNSSSASSSISSTNFGVNNNSDKIVESKLKVTLSEEELNAQQVRAEAEIGGSNSVAVVGEVSSLAVGSSASSKKKSKRRRNQALPKGRTTQSIRKVTGGNNSCNTAPGGTKFYSQHHYAHHRKSSPTWDTDFKGCWEMGPDLIKEFLSRQKGTTKSSRSTSESMDIGRRNDCPVAKEDLSTHGTEFKPGSERPKAKRSLVFDVSFCLDDDEDRQRYDIEDGVDYVDEDYDDDNTLASLPELSNDLVNPRRLYQREAILKKPSAMCSVVHDNNNRDETLDSVNQLDFDSLKAKFNSSVEALWKDAEPQQTLFTKGNATDGISSAFYASTSLNAPAPFKHELWNFWSNYNQHHYDPAAKFSTAASTSSMITTRLDDSSASSGAGADIANSSDYFSMPSNLDDFDKSVGAVRRANEAGASLDAHTPSINVFLQNSIWSSSGDCVDAVGAAAAGETDESFLYKVWHSNRKLSQLDVGNTKGEKITDADGAISFNKPKEPLITLGDVGGGAKLEFPPYNRLKWSEGINAGPSYNSLRPNNVPCDLGGMESLPLVDNKFASFGSAATVTGANWEAPVYGQHSQPDLKSWCASNPMSLTEMYGSDVCDSISQEQEAEAKLNTDGPTVTLPNHCAATSGFIAYSRIKKCGLVPPLIKPVPQQSASASRLPKAYFQDEEEENLLTSESTHFHPIESFVDGHSFNISDALDEVPFERSASGYLCYESTEYAEYTRNDIYLADEEVSKSKWMKMVTYSPCNNLPSKKQSHQSPAVKPMENEMDESKDDAFVIKFRLRRTGEIACQTEEIDFQLAAAKIADPQRPVEDIEMPMFHNNALETTTKQANNEAIIVAVTKAVAAAAKAAAQQSLNLRQSSMSWVPITKQDCGHSWAQDPSLCDEVDFCKAEHLSQYWSMQEVEKQCHQRRLPSAAYQRAMDIDGHDENSLDGSSHTLWGMCAVCNSCDFGKSMPADRLLRDELKLEADEIMSDLRYMQDLYIGEAEDGCPDNVDNDRNIDVWKTVGSQEDNILVDVADTTAVDHVQATMLQKVNQLIEDLLRPEQTGILNKSTSENETEVGAASPKEIKHIENVWSANAGSDRMVDNDNAQSWHYGNESLTNIWQHESQKIKKLEVETNNEEKKCSFTKPMKLLRQVGGSLNEEQLYMEKLNWEHDNLAKIWQQNAIASPEEESLAMQQQSEIEENTGEIAKEMNIVKDNDEIVEKKNLKNLQCINTGTGTQSSSNAATYKRVQQFLNTSAAKLKLAANRKRRHSASQNFYYQQQQQQLQQQQQQQHNLQNYNNNNNDNITDLNRYQQQTIVTGAATEELSLPQEPKQTIITCKYWTTSTNGTQASLDSAAAAMMLLAAATNTSKADSSMMAGNDYDDTHARENLILEPNTFGNALSCLIDKNASILKHVTMMTRPLTR